MHGKTLKIYVRGQSSRSLKSVELSNWTGMAFIGERSHIKLARQIDDLSDTGVYLLLSPPEDSGEVLTKIYIGETENFSKRISNHQQKDWWTRFVVFVSKDRNLTKAHVRFLESKLHKMAKEAVSTLKVMNDSEPTSSKLPVSDEATMHEFADHMIFVLETLGLSYFPVVHSSVEDIRGSSEPSRPDYSTTEGMEFQLTVPKTNAKARMRGEEGKFILLSGSFIRADAVESFEKHSYYSLWKQIVKSDAVDKTDDLKLLQTNRDIEFRSPSAAAAVAMGRTANGRARWKRLTDDRMLGECESDDLDSAA
jgi:hypothetical protein